MAKGTFAAPGVGKPRVAITFGQDLIERINSESERKKQSFSEVVRRACEVYLDFIEG